MIMKIELLTEQEPAIRLTLDLPNGDGGGEPPAQSMQVIVARPAEQNGAPPSAAPRMAAEEIEPTWEDAEWQ
jgi:hypothetical protein